MSNAHKKAFTLSELIVGLVITAIVVLMIGAMGTVATKSYSDLRKQSDVHNDVQFAINLMRESFRKSTSAPTVSSGCLSVTVSADTKKFYKINNNLVYGSTCDGNTNTTMISGVTSLVFTPSISGKLLTIVLNGSKDGINFDYSVKAARRN